ncbi:MAG: hypothetical protein PHH54_00535 [Candidatus Nanoarchaeia archaeon]|nr:hypothetical protein [Candidatus Nanoarchaeia archaeon]MDD5740449.1 hypothetical protein [Candidatus Nanoarchaeia archaeon]
MTDIFNNTILCGKCNIKMKPVEIHKNGFVLRAVMCPKCESKIIHPKDEQEYNNFTDLKKKEFNVKMRFVGNSYAVSIPKEIVDFMQEQEKIMNEMVRLSLEEFGRISLSFGNQNHNHENDRIRAIKELKEKNKEVN